MVSQGSARREPRGSDHPRRQIELAPATAKCGGSRGGGGGKGGSGSGRWRSVREKGGGGDVRERAAALG